MEKKSNRSLTRRRPPNLNLRGGSPCLRAEALETQSSARDNEDLNAIQPVFASVHRPRHASISSIRRDINQPQQCQQVLIRSSFRPILQNNSPNELVQIPERDNVNSNRIRLCESRKTGWDGPPHNQSIAVAIPQPFRQLQQQQQQQPIQHGLQAPPLPIHSVQYIQVQQQAAKQTSSSSSHNRIPMVQQNFNQISKTATNLLNDIYEKHLLSQTTFENVTILNSRALTGMSVVGGMPSSIGFSQPAVNHGICTADGDFNLNNFQQKQQSISRNHHQHVNHHQQPYRNCQQIQLQQLPLGNISNHQSSLPPTQNLQIGMAQDPSQHVYETVDGPPSSSSSCHMGGGALIVPNRVQRKRTPGKIQKLGKNLAMESKQSNPSNQKKHVSVGSEENYFGMSGTVQQSNQHQQQQQQQQQQHHHHQKPPLRPFYNHQPRTRADGENDSSSIGSSGNNKVIHPLQSSSQSVPQFALERTSANETGDGMQNIRGAPSGSAAGQGDHECSESVEYFPEAEGLCTPGIAKFQYRNSKIDLMLETAQAMAAAAYYAKAAQKLAQNGPSKSKSTDMSSANRNGGYCGALQRAPPSMPPGLARRLANKESYGIGKVKVMLRVSDSHADEEIPHFMSIDKKKRQVTLTDPATNTVVASTSQERGPMVAAPKMFAFDGLFTADDQQSDVCSSALSEVIPAVLEGSDGCLLTIGYPTSGQSRTMLGVVNPPSELGAIPCAISWLYKGINERRQKSGARFSVRVSALGVSATKPDSSSKDLLAAHATDSDDSPGVYLRDDFLGGPTELRAPTAERAALFLDAALAGRPQSGLEPAMIFTLHVYQYSLSRKGGVAGGRSRLHLIDLGGCANRNGGLPLSGIGNVLLAILSGQRHPPNKDHPLTPLLKDCLAPLTCHVTIMAHVTHTQSHADALTTIQLASRIHRMRRRKHRFPISSDKALGVNNAGHQSGGSSEGPDPSSSDLSADTVIYMGPCDDATDGEHPPVYLPSLSSGDNRCAMNKVLKGSVAEKPSKIPAKKAPAKSQSPIPHRTDSVRRINVPSSSPTPPSSDMPTQPFSPVHSSPKMVSSSSSPKIVAGALRHVGISKGSNVPTPKSSPLRRPNNVQNPESPMRQISEEQWIDGPRVSRAKVAEARHLLREINHVKQCETWIDGPKSKSVASSPAKPLTAGNLPGNNQPAGYGFMDTHKKIMIRQWVENQSSHVFQSPTGSPTHQTQQQQQQQQQMQQQLRTITYHLTQFKQKSDDDQHSVTSNSEMVNPVAASLLNVVMTQSNNNGAAASESSMRSGLKLQKDETDMHSEKSGLSVNVPNYQESTNIGPEDQEDQDSGPSEVPPALPLIEPLGSREISHESLHRIISRHVSRESLSMNQQNVQTMDCGLQVTEEEIARTMGCEHPLAALSHGDISIVSSFNIGDAFSDCAMGERTRNQFDQLARLREIFTSQLAMAEVTPAFRIGDAGSVYSEPAFRFNPGPGSVCSEPAYRPPSPRCRGCRQSINASRTPSQSSLPSLNGIMTIAGMEQYASLRHPDGASDPNLQKAEKSVAEDEDEPNEKSTLLKKKSSIDPEIDKTTTTDHPVLVVSQTHLPLLPLSTSEAYDSGHDSSTPRTSKHSGISRRAESGYHSVATARDSDESSSFTSAISKEHNRITMKKKRQDKSLCNWLRNPFTCTYPETEGEISDF